MYRPALTIAAFAGFALCASCATVQQTAEKPGDQPEASAVVQAGAPAVAPAALEEGRIETLTVGDPAPPLAIAHWVRGEEVPKFEQGKVYVVEFWATWCGPCLASMPHLSDLQDQYADYGVRIIGVSNEPLETIEEFLTRSDSEGVQWTEKIRYSLTTNPDRSTHVDYMRAAEQNFIPTAFVVGKTGKIEWIGSPRDMDDVLHAVVHDEWDREPAREKHLREATAQRRERIARDKMTQARRDQDWETVLALIDEQIKASDGHPRFMYQRFVTLIADVKSFHAGYGYGERLVDKAWDDANVLNSVAWFVADDKRVEKRDLNFALRAAERAVELTDEKNAAILDTLARVYYELGEINEALKWQRLAVEHAQEGRMGDEIRETLEKYEAQAAAR